MGKKSHSVETMSEKPSMASLLDAIGECAAGCQFEEENALKTELAPILNKRIILEGIISGGKTTAGKMLEEFLAKEVGVRAKFIPEQFNPEMLALFYAEMEKVEKKEKEHNDAAFPMQLQMLHLRQENYKEAIALVGQGDISSSVPHTVIEDRFVWGDAVFASLHRASGNISADQFRVYLSALKKFKYGPAFIVFLDVTAPEAWRRKKERARPDEKIVSQGYLHSLRLGYYMLLRALFSKTKVKVLLLRNDKWHSPLYILRRIARCPPPEVTRDFIAKRSAPLTGVATEPELDAAFENIHKLYDEYDEGKASK